jgi:hypothetical protein
MQTLGGVKRVALPISGVVVPRLAVLARSRSATRAPRLHGC